MPTPTYMPIANITLTSTAASVTFSSITQQYRDLVLVSNQMSASDNVDGNLEFNGDTANYTRVFIYATGGAVASSYGTDRQAFVPRVDPGTFIAHIMDYSATDKHKTTLITSNQASYLTYNQASRWANTAAVTSLRILPAVGSWNVGASFALYGLVA